MGRYQMTITLKLRHLKTLSVTIGLSLACTYLMVITSPRVTHSSLAPRLYRDPLMSVTRPARIASVSSKTTGNHTDVSFESTKEKTFLETIDRGKIKFDMTAFGDVYKLNSTRSTEFDFPFIIDGRKVCSEGVDNPFLVIMVPSVHTHIDTRVTIRNTWGRAANPGVWPKVGELVKKIKLIFLFGTSMTVLGNSIVEEEMRMYGDIVQADFVDSYFNLTYKSVMGLRWVAQYCPGARYVLKADEDVFVHVKNLIDFLDSKTIPERGIMLGHMLRNSEVLREGRWAVSKDAFPLAVYPNYTCGNTYVVSANIAAHVYYTAGLLPYLNIEDVFVTGIVRSFLGVDLIDGIGFTHWFQRKPKPCEFKNKVRISATKVEDYLQTDIWEGLKRSNLLDCYVLKNRTEVKARRPDWIGTRQLMRDDHILRNKTSGMFYVL